ncbi:hypothetical protein [Mycolicibacterium sp.]|uniref:hypothetical protein n=1 Tax=Mycolicibacterium sp. TaxID=2320850 RepID=UPI0037C9D089
MPNRWKDKPVEPARRVIYAYYALLQEIQGEPDVDPADAAKVEKIIRDEGNRTGLHPHGQRADSVSQRVAAAALVPRPGSAKLDERVQGVTARWLELGFTVGPSRNWLNLWKPAVDSLGALLGHEQPFRHGTLATAGSLSALSQSIAGVSGLCSDSCSGADSRNTIQPSMPGGGFRPLRGMGRGVTGHVRGLRRGA